MHVRLWLGLLALFVMAYNEVQSWTYHYNVDTDMNWKTAFHWCRQHHTGMVAIQNKEEIAHLNQVLPFHKNYYWIGIRKVEGQWVWVATQKPLSAEAANWATDEPNDKGVGEDCVEIYIKRSKDTAMWNDAKCSLKKAALCYKASCFQSSCSKNAECVETIGNFTCLCASGFSGRLCEKVIQCPPMTNTPGGGSMNCSHPLNTDSYNSTCVFSCEEGFDLIGSNITQCDHTGQWTHQTPTCTAVTCDPIVTPEKGHMTCADPLGKFSFRSSCALSCEEGYTLRGEDTLACLKTGRWSAETPTCEAVMCGAPQSVPFGSLHCVDPVGEFRYGSSCWSECHVGFLLVGTNVTHCTSQGTWSDTLPVCQAVQCGPLSAASSGWIMNCSHPINTDSYNSTCVFSCEEGFDLIGSNITQCDHTGQWTYQTPTCTAVMCGALQSVPFGSLHCVNPVGEFRYGSSCWSECHIGFLLVGTNVTHCTSQGTWSDTLPVCQAVQCDPLSAASSGWIMNCSHPLNTDSYNSTCVFSCEEGFDLIGSNITQCDHTGQWTHQTPTCTAVMCGAPQSVPFGSLHCVDPVGEFRYGSSCWSECHVGFLLVGTNVTHCTSQGTWSDTLPVCQAVQCGPLSAASSGWIMYCSHPINTDSYNSTCVFSCEEGFELIGSNITQCDHTGQWTHQTPTCTAVQCEPLSSPDLPGVPSVPSMNCTHPRALFSFGSQCLLQCPEGYVLNGTSELNCTSSGLWTHTEAFPTCMVEETPLGTAMLVYVAAGMGSSLCLLIGAGLIVLLVQTFTKKAKFTPDTAAWEGSLNPAFEDI